MNVIDLVDEIENKRVQSSVETDLVVQQDVPNLLFVPNDHSPEPMYFEGNQHEGPLPVEDVDRRQAS